MLLDLNGRVHLWQNLAMGLKAGFRVEDAIAHAAAGGGPGSGMARALRGTGQASLAGAVHGVRGRFSDLEVSVVEAAERAGKLPETLNGLAEYLRERRDEMGRLLMRIAYPVLICHLAAFAGAVAPSIAGRQSTSGLVGGFVFALVPFYAVTLALFVLPRALRRVGPGMALLVDRIALGIPVAGAFFRNEAETEFCWLAGTLLSAGVPIRETLTFAAERLTNRAFREELRAVEASVAAGEPLAESLDRSRVLSPSARAQVGVAEGAGTLSDTFVALSREARERRSLIGHGLSGAIWALFFVMAILYVVRTLTSFYGGYAGRFDSILGP